MNAKIGPSNFIYHYHLLPFNFRLLIHMGLIILFSRRLRSKFWACWGVCVLSSCRNPCLRRNGIAWKIANARIICFGNFRPAEVNIAANCCTIKQSNTTCLLPCFLSNLPQIYRVSGQEKYYVHLFRCSFSWTSIAFWKTPIAFFTYAIQRIYWLATWKYYQHMQYPMQNTILMAFNIKQASPELLFVYYRYLADIYWY